MSNDLKGKTATGITRRIDDLGRVVIPKEIRQKVRFVEGDSLELFLEDDMVCFKKYRPTTLAEDLARFAVEVAENATILSNQQNREVCGQIRALADRLAELEAQK